MEAKFLLGEWTTKDYSINQTTLKLAAANISTPAMLDYLNMMTSEGFIQQSETEMNQAIVNKMIALVTPKTVLSDALTVNSTFGNMTSDGQVSWTAPIKTPQDLVAYAKANLNLRVSTALVNNLIDTAYPQPAATDMPAANMPPTEDSITKQISAWNKQKQLSIDVAAQLQDLVKVHLDAKVFATNIDRFVARKDVPTDIAAQLKELYAQMMAPHPADVVPKPEPTVSRNQMAKAMVAGWLKEGYIRQEGDDYVTAVTFDQGALKANGVDLTPLLQTIPQQANVPAPAAAP